MKTLLTIIIAFTAVSSLLAQSTLTIRLGQDNGYDCQIFTYNPNIGSYTSTEAVAATWTFGGDINLWRGLFKFNLTEIPPGVTIQNAVLTLYCNPYPNSQTYYGANESYLKPCLNSWNQYSVNWNNQPDYITQNQVYMPQSQYYFQDYDINVTEMIRNQYQNPGQNHGFVIMNVSESYPLKCLNFASSECIIIEKRPKLVITYTPVGIEPISSNVPEKFEMYQNYPNPFNPSTTINFDISKSSHVILSVYDQIGREVSVLANETLQPGTYKVKWDGSNFQSGVYFIRMETSSGIFTKKMTLVK